MRKGRGTELSFVDFRSQTCMAFLSPLSSALACKPCMKRSPDESVLIRGVGTLSIAALCRLSNNETSCEFLRDSFERPRYNF